MNEMNTIPDADRNKTTTPALDALTQIAQHTLEDLKAHQIESLFIGDVSSVADIMIVASGTSKRHVQSIAQALITQVKSQNMPLLGTEGLESGEWVLVDLGDVIVHIMQPSTRDFYDLEKLWKVKPSQPELEAPA